MRCYCIFIEQRGSKGLGGISKALQMEGRGETKRKRYLRLINANKVFGELCSFIQRQIGKLTHKTGKQAMSISRCIGSYRLIRGIRAKGYL